MTAFPSTNRAHAARLRRKARDAAAAGTPALGLPPALVREMAEASARPRATRAAVAAAVRAELARLEREIADGPRHVARLRHWLERHGPREEGR